jgi:hypothetical protein
VAASPTTEGTQDVEEPLGNGEAIAFQAPAGETVRGVLLSAPGPNQRVLVFAAPNAGRYRDMYTELVEPGLAVLVFSVTGEGETLAAQIETAARLVRSRDYPLIYLGGADDACEAALVAASSVDPAGVVTISPPAADFENTRIDLPTPKLLIGSDGSEGLAALGAGVSEPKQIEALEGEPLDSPAEVANIIRGFMMP